jgi:hypothetical protein
MADGKGDSKTPAAVLRRLEVLYRNLTRHWYQNHAREKMARSMGG